MEKESIDEFRKRMEKEDIEVLRRIWHTKHRNEWTDDEFTAVGRILREREGDSSAQPQGAADVPAQFQTAPEPTSEYGPNLLPGENVLMSSDDNTLVLTNCRVRYDASGVGASRYVGMTLDAVSSCGLVTRSWPILLVLAAIAALGGVLLQSEESTIFGLVVGAILALAYFLSRSAVLSINSNGGEDIVVPAKGLGREKVVYFLQAVENAKLNYLGMSSKAR